MKTSTDDVIRMPIFSDSWAWTWLPPEIGCNFLQAENCKKFFGCKCRPQETDEINWEVNCTITVAWKGHTLQFTAVTSTKEPSRLQFTPSRLQNTRHVYKSAVKWLKSTIRNRHVYKTSCECRRDGCEL